MNDELDEEGRHHGAESFEKVYERLMMLTLKLLIVELPKYLEKLLDWVSHPSTMALPREVRDEAERCANKINEILCQVDDNIAYISDYIKSGKLQVKNVPFVVPVRPKEKPPQDPLPPAATVHTAKLIPGANAGRPGYRLQIDDKPETVFLPERVGQLLKHILDAPDHTISRKDLRALMGFEKRDSSSVRRLLQRLRRLLKEAHVPASFLDVSRRSVVRILLT
ncbi:MAG: hypothetical protein KA184_15320 [Candidatus Hydrogenedentes bacterium]|nr:hypothetical protein [Candidatus Hydrogenedentota bacterium]